MDRGITRPGSGRGRKGLAGAWWGEPRWRELLGSIRIEHPAPGEALIEVVAAHLETVVREAGLRPGDRLPPERYLAAALGVSRGTVREALRELELKGLVERRQGAGTVVADPDPGGIGDDLIGRLDADARTWVEVMDLREAIEVPIAERAARYATRSDLRRLAAVLDEMEGARDAARYAELDARFHRLVAEASHNPLLVKVVEFTSRWLELTRRSRLQSARRRARWLEGHRAVYAAIARGDPGGAAAAMREHIRTIVEELGRRGRPARRGERSG